MIIKDLIVIFLIAYILIVSVLLISHRFGGRKLDKYRNDVNREKSIWIKRVEYIKKRDSDLLTLPDKDIKKIKKPLMLVAFYKMLSNFDETFQVKLMEDNSDSLIKYAKELDDLSKAYFAYILGNVCLGNSNAKAEYEKLLLDYLDVNSVHLRENSLKALYCLGNPEAIKEAYVRLSAMDKQHSEKLMSDGLMNGYNGDRNKLFEVMIDSFDDLLECYQDAVVTFMFRENNHTYDEFLKKYLSSNNNSMDLQCAIIRLIGKDCSEENGVFFADYMNNMDEEKYWEGIAVVANVLGNFTRTEYIASTLCHALTSKFWYIRMNSAKALCKIGINDDDIEKVKEMNDKYASEALMFAVNNI